MKTTEHRFGEATDPNSRMQRLVQRRALSGAPRLRSLVGCAMGVAVVAANPNAAAQPRELRWNGAVDGTVVGVGAAAWLASELLFRSHLAPATCHWCDVDGLDRDARQALLWCDPSPADTASSVVAFGLAPISAALTLGLAANHDGAFSHVFGPDVLIASEAAVIAIDIDQVTKFVAGRERPFVHALPSWAKGHTDDPVGNNLSFFSGHTTATFALAAAAGTVASMRRYRWASLTWATGGALAFTTAYLRIAADKHWLTDVLVGMAIGTAVGIVVPYVFHRPDDESGTSTFVRRSSPVLPGPMLGMAW
jgi:membrane-associated phospholipid phosphatase